MKYTQRDAKKSPSRYGKGKPNAFYLTAGWRRLRHAVLVGQPWCKMCHDIRGIMRRATEVDHIIPISIGGATEDPVNLQPLCSRCHWMKTTFDLRIEKGQRLRGLDFFAYTRYIKKQITDEKHRRLYARYFG